MADGLLSLSWNNHSATFCHALSSLRAKERYADVTLSCEGKFYSVHKLVLSTCSEYFENIFEQTPCKHPIIVLSNIQHTELEAILSYMYDGAVTVSQTNLPRLIKVAELLQIKGLAVHDEPPKSSSAPLHRRQSQDSSSGRNSPLPRTKSSHSSNETSEEPQPKRIRRETDLIHDNPLESPNSQHVEDSIEFMTEEKYDPRSQTVAETESESQTLASSQESNCEDYIKKEVTEAPKDSESSVADPGVPYVEGGLSDLPGGDSLEALKHQQPPGTQPLVSQESYSEEMNTTVAGPSDMQTWFGSEPLSALPTSKANAASDNQFFGFSSPQPTQKRVLQYHHQLDNIQFPLTKHSLQLTRLQPWNTEENLTLRSPVSGTSECQSDSLFVAKTSQPSDSQAANSQDQGLLKNPWPHLEYYFKLLCHGRDNHRILYFECQICHPTKKIVKGHITSLNNLKSHVRRTHPSIAIQFEEEIKAGSCRGKRRHHSSGSSSMHSSSVGVPELSIMKAHLWQAPGLSQH